MLKRDETLGRRVRKPAGFLLGMALCGFIYLSPAPAAVLDFFGPPPPGDPSEQTGPYIGLQYADNALKPCIDNVANNPPGCTVGLLPTNEGALILQGDVPGDPRRRGPEQFRSGTRPVANGGGGLQHPRPTAGRARLFGARRSPSRCCSSRSSAPSRSTTPHRPQNLPSRCPRTTSSGPVPAGAGGLPGAGRDRAVPDAALEHRGSEPLETGDRKFPRPPARGASRGRTAARGRVGPPAVERVLPAGLLQDRPGGRARERRLPRRQADAPLQVGEFGPAGSITRSTGPTVTPTSRRNHERHRDPVPPEHADSGSISPSGPSTGPCRPSCSWRATGSRS